MTSTRHSKSSRITSEILARYQRLDRVFENSPQLSKTAANILEAGESQVFVSIASIWEAAIKIGLGKLRLPYDLKTDLPAILDDCGFELLTIEFEDAVAVQTLDPIHGDLFDRLQIVQAKRSDLAVITRDPVFEQYGLRRIW